MINSIQKIACSISLLITLGGVVDSSCCDVGSSDAFGSIDAPYHAPSPSPDIPATPSLIPWMDGNYYSKQGILQMLGRQVNVNEPDNEGNTPLHWATINDGNLIVTEFLLDRNANVDQLNNEGNTPLHVASFYGKQASAQILIDAGAAVDKQDMYGRTPLYLASARGYADIVKILIKHNANVYLPRKGGYTPLHIATFYGHLEIVQLLIAAGATFNTPDNDCMPPLLWATQQGHKKVIDLLTHYNGIALTIALSTHKRLGAASPMALLSQNLIGNITCLVVQSEAHDACRLQAQRNFMIGAPSLMAQFKADDTCPQQKQRESNCFIL